MRGPRRLSGNPFGWDRPLGLSPRDEAPDDVVLRARNELDLAHEAGGRGAQQEAQRLAEIGRLDHLLGLDSGGPRP
jgi:hypothetical protein